MTSTLFKGACGECRKVYARVWYEGPESDHHIRMECPNGHRWGMCLHRKDAAHTDCKRRINESRFGLFRICK